MGWSFAFKARLLLPLCGLIFVGSGCGNSQTSGDASKITAAVQANHDKWEQAKANGSDRAKNQVPLPEVPGSMRSKYMQKH